MSQPRYRDEKPYKHVSVHAASSFVASTTTAAMIDMMAKDHYEPGRDAKEPGRDAKERMVEDSIEEKEYRRIQGSLI